MGDIEHSSDVVKATAELIERCGGSAFQIGHMGDDKSWYAVAEWQGTKLIRNEMPSPSTAALALAERVLYKALCRCGEMVTIDGEDEGCRWQLLGPVWVPGCEAEPVKVEGKRGDRNALEAAMTARHGSDRVERAKRARP